MLHPLAQALCTLGRRATWVAFGASCALTVVNMRTVRLAPSAEERPPSVLPGHDVAKPIEPAIQPSALVATLRPTPQTVTPSSVGPRAFSLSDIGACHRARGSQGIYASEWSVTYVTPAEVERLLEARETFGSLAHFIPGAIAGTRIQGIRPDDPVRRMGFVNGDVVLSVNGYELSTPERVLVAYGHLRNAADLTVIFLRDGALQARLIRIC